MAKIYSPNKGYCGISATVVFVNGVGETENEHLIRWFKEKGYEVKEEKEEGVVSKKMTVEELKEFAKENDIDLESEKKADIIEEINEKMEG